MAAMVAPPTKLFVGCLPYSVTEADLMPIFSQFGPTQEVLILKQPDGKSKGAAFVTYQSPWHARTAMAALQNFAFPGSTRPINISVAGSAGGGGGGVGGARQSHSVNMYFAGSAGGGGAHPFGASSAGKGGKVFVGQLPFSKSEHDLLQLFSAIGPVAEVTLLKDRITQEKKGCAFVSFASSHRAQAAVSALNGFTFNGSPRPIVVSIAANDNAANQNRMGAMRAWNGQGASNDFSVIHQMGQLAPGAMQLCNTASGPFSSQEGTKIFVGQLPFSQSEASIAEAFSKFGPVEEVFLHKDAQGQKKGACFVRYYDAEHATLALSMHGHLFRGATRPITVQFASENETKRRKLN